MSLFMIAGKIKYTVLVWLICCFNSAFADEPKAAIASAHPLATEAGFEILAKGGNAFDAAVAISAALAVVEPSGSGLGGGGFWLLYKADTDESVMLDGREKAPLAAHKNMFLDQNGAIIPNLSKDGALAAGIPGLPAALVHLAEEYGELELSESLQPAIRYARDGFTIGNRHRKLLGFRTAVLKKNPESARILLDNGEVPAENALLKQPDLAHTLELLAAQGKAGFYQGETAAKLLASVKAAGGIWTQADLDAYQVLERQPVQGQYKNIKITSAAPPSAGGIALVEALNILAGYELDKLEPVTRTHIIAEAMRRVFHDRALYLGDPDFLALPLTQLLSVDYATGLRSAMRLDKALPSAWLSGEIMPEQTGTDTSHFSVIDAEGNRVAATLSINFPFGAGIIAKGTGVILNNEMDDFAAKVGALNGYGLVGNVANAIAPGKRMLSSMSPTFLEDGSRIAVLGTPGGSQIISMVLLATLDFAAGHGAESWVKTTRFHHQYIPDEILYEPNGLSAAEISGLTALGHKLKQKSYAYGNMQAVEFNKKTGELNAASDPRGEGLADVR